MNIRNFYKNNRAIDKVALIILCLFALFAVFGISQAIAAVPGETYIVTNTDDSGPGSLRQAIMDANAHPGLDAIVFDIPEDGTQVIKLLELLPPIVDPVRIDGSTQHGYGDGAPVVWLNGELVDKACRGPANGSYRDYPGIDVRKDPDSSVDASGTTIKGLKVSDFCVGIVVSGEVDEGMGCVTGGDNILNVTVADNVIVHNDGGNAALDLCNTVNSLVSGNWLDNKTDNIEVAKSDKVTVIGNYARNGKDGLSLVRSTRIAVVENKFEGTSTGIHMKFEAQNNLVYDNVIRDVARFGLALSHDNKVRGNIITGSGWFGIEIRGGEKNEVWNNTLMNNGFSREEPIFAGIVVGPGSRRALGVNCSVNDLGEPYDCDEDAQWNPFYQGSSFKNHIHDNLIAYNNGPGILLGGTFNEWVPGTEPEDWDPVNKAFIGETTYFTDKNKLHNNEIFGNVGIDIDITNEMQFLYHDLPEPYTEYYVEIQAAKPDGS